eukprot:scaffold36894_cov63-Phaeocystis_antarctica.AAC.4
MSSADSSFGAAPTTLADSALSPSSFHHPGLATSAPLPWPLPSPPSPPGSAPWPRGATARPPRCAPSWRALHRGCSTPQAGRAPGQWPRGRPWLLYASPAENYTAVPPPTASSTRRPSARCTGPAPPPPRESAAATPHHPLAPFAASSPSCETPRAAAKRQGSPGSSRRR